MKPFLLILILLALPACTYTGEHGSITFHPTPELLERAGIKLHPVLRDKK